MIVSKRLEKKEQEKLFREVTGNKLSTVCVGQRENTSTRRRRVSYDNATTAPRTPWNQVGGYDRIVVKVIPSQMNMEAPIIIPEDPSLVQ